jgi:hypothetical protein
LSNSLNWLSHSNHIPTYYWKDFTIGRILHRVSPPAGFWWNPTFYA